MANWMSLLVVVTVAIAQHAHYDTNTDGESTGKSRRKEPHRLHELTRMLDRKFPKCKIIMIDQIPTFFLKMTKYYIRIFMRRKIFASRIFKISENQWQKIIFKISENQWQKIIFQIS